MKTRHYQIEWMLLGTVLLVLGALIGYWLYKEHNQVESWERDRLQTQARVIDENLGHQLEGVNNALAGVRDEFPLPGNKSAAQAASRHLKALSNAMPGVRTMTIADAKGTVIASSRDELIGRDVSELEIFKAVHEHPDPATFYVSPPFKTLLGTYSIIVGREVAGFKGEFAGIVSATLDPEYFNVVLRSVLYAPDMRTSIAHSDGKGFLYVPPIQNAADLDLAVPGSFFSRHRESRQTATVMTGTVHATGEERMMAMRTVARADLRMDKPLVVAVSRDLAAIYLSWRRQMLAYGVLYALFFAAAILGMLLYQRRKIVHDRIDAGHETERKRTEQALRQSEDRYGDLVENSQDLICTHDLEGRLLSVNAAAVRLTGYSREALLGMNTADLLTRGARDGFAAYLAEIQTKGAARGLMRIRTADGKRRWREYQNTLRIAGVEAPVVRGMAQDITERKQAEEALREALQRLKFHAENSPLAVVEFDREFRVIFWSNVAQHIFGWSADEILGKRIDQLRWVHEEDAARVAALGADMFAGRGTRNVHTNRNYCKDGSVIICEWYNSALIDSAGNLVSVLSLIVDITERKQAEDALRESEARFRAIASHTPDHILMQDRDLRYSFVVNPRLGLTEADMIGKTDRDFLGKEDAEKLTAIKRKVLETGESVQLETSLRNPKGETEFFEGAYIPKFDSTGKADGLIGYFRNITERKRAEEALRNRESVLQRIFDLLPVGLWFSDKDGKLLRGNPAGVKIWGAEPQVDLSEYGIFKARRLRSGEELAADDWALAHSIRDRVTIVDELLEIDAFDGKKKTILNYTAPVLDAEGEVQGAIVVNQDITERKRAEDALRKTGKRMRDLSQRLIEVEDGTRRTINRELHDRVGANLSALNLNLSILRSQLPQESLRAVGARIEDTQMLLEETTTHVRDLMADLHPPALDDYGLLAALRTHVESVGARFAVPISVHGEALVSRLPLAVETALFRVAQGALVNAVTHAHAKRIEILLAASPDRVALTIADDGAGFDVAEAAQARASWGLAIMRERAEAVGAELTVESTPGKGTRVCVEISREKR